MTINQEQASDSAAAPFNWMEGWDEPLVGEGPFRVIGIDLGTTNSTITEVVWQPGGGPPVVDVIEVAQPTGKSDVVRDIVRDIVPSVVARVGTQVYVGEGAQRLRGDDRYRLNKDIFWGAKNEIGTSRTYTQAPEGFQNPREVATHVLDFLRKAAEENAGGDIDRVVITVPASFQWTQRRDTLQAAQDAGLDVLAGDLLDEPVAAFLDFLVTNGPDALPTKSGRLTTLVLDFGGGTCDVAILQVTRAGDGGIDIAREAVSRFHRIGGSDVDDQIAHEFLLPQLMQQNDKSAKAYSYSDKRDHLLPALAGIAQNLKIKLSERIAQLQRLGAYDPDVDETVTLPGRTPIPTGKMGEVLDFDTPSLSLPQFRRATRRFVNPTLLTPEAGEYTMAMSVFAPVQDALDRCNLDREDVDAVLIVGGSGLLPPFVEAVSKYFRDATILRFDEPRDALRCVGRGAAYHALLLAAYGASPLRPTTGDALSLRVRGGATELVPRNVPLPYPAKGQREVAGLSMPGGDGESPTTLRLELVSGSGDEDELTPDERLLHSKMADIEAPAKAGDPITVKVSVDENQVVSLSASISSGSSSQTVELSLDNPFSVVENPGKDRERLIELEERLRARPPKKRRPAAFIEIAKLHSKLGSPERAREMYERILPLLTPSRQSDVCNSLGILCGELRDHDAQADYYRESARLGGGSGPLFNLALTYWKQGNRLDEALELIDEAIIYESSAPYRILRADILGSLGRTEESKAELRKAIDEAEILELDEQRDFTLGWIRGGASELGKREMVKEIDTIQKKRRQQGAVIDDSDNLPVRDE